MRGSINTTSASEYLSSPEGGYILVDSSILVDFLNKTLHCLVCDGSANTFVDFKNSKGFAMSVYSQCHHCTKSKSSVLFSTSKKVCEEQGGENPKGSYEVNLRIVTFVRELGKGHTALDTFLSVMNTTTSHSSYDGLLAKLHSASLSMAKESTAQGGIELKEEVSSDTIVSIDGTWHRRGHSSHNGVVAVVASTPGIEPVTRARMRGLIFTVLVFALSRLACYLFICVCMLQLVKLPPALAIFGTFVSIKLFQLRNWAKNFFETVFNVCFFFGISIILAL